MLVKLRDEAIDDLADGAYFYDRKSEGVGDHFLDCLNSDLKVLEDTAGIHETAYGFHRKLAKRFPFAIYYQLAGERVDVVAILDCRLKPETISLRLKRTPKQPKGKQ